MLDAGYLHATSVGTGSISVRIVGGYAFAFHAKPRFTNRATPAAYFARADLIRNKRASGRLQDLAALEELE